MSQYMPQVPRCPVLRLRTRQTFTYGRKGRRRERSREREDKVKVKERDLLEREKEETAFPNPHGQDFHRSSLRISSHTVTSLEPMGRGKERERKRGRDLRIHRVWACLLHSRAWRRGLS